MAVPRKVAFRTHFDPKVPQRNRHCGKFVRDEAKNKGIVADERLVPACGPAPLHRRIRQGALAGARQMTPEDACGWRCFCANTSGDNGEIKP
jgi:hypothetical protein